jgi:tetratricopeptide (TPR) repeat protein
MMRLKNILLTLVAVLLSAGAVARAQEPPKFAYEALPEKKPATPAGFRVCFPLRIVGDPAAQATPTTVIARIPAGGWLKPDGSDITVLNAAGAAAPVTILSHDPNGDTLIQFPRTANDKWYWAFASNPAAPALAATPPAKEGLFVEYRQWAGENIDSWATIVNGLKKSDNVIGNAPLSEVIANGVPAKPYEPRHFAASYRGFLNITKPGAYRFLVNGQDACFLFIDGLKVYERPGQNERMHGRIPVSTNGALIDLTAGVHPFEVHHVVGNNPQSFGYCTFIWVPPPDPAATPTPPAWAYVPPEAFVQSLHATVADVQDVTGAQLNTFGYGIDDVLTTINQSLYLVRFEAQGVVKDPNQLTWDFGDGTTGTGKSVLKVYFKEGSYPVKLKSSATLPPVQRTVNVWASPVISSPYSLGNAVKALAAQWQKLDLPRMRQAFGFLQVCEQPDRWTLLEAISRHLLAQPQTDPAFRTTLHIALMESLAEQGKGPEALQQGDVALKEFEKTPSLQIRIKLAAGDVNFRHLREIDAASKIYNAIIEDNRRVEVPEVRLAAIRLGDMYTETGELPKAAEAYRMAGTLGGAKYDTTAQTDAITRGAMLRVAEQRLKAGDVRQTRDLMEKIEIQYPEQKLEGLYRFLRAEADRMGGRYEEAIDNYQVLLKLPQWAGYRNKALFGVADSYFRSDDYGKAIEWLDSLETSFPTFYDEEKLPNYRRTVETRMAREKGAAGTGFAGFSYSFEPDEKTPVPEPPTYPLVRGLGMGGTEIGLLEGIPAMVVSADWSVRLRNIRSNGWYWVELWHREAMNRLPAGSHMHSYLYGTGDETDPQKGIDTRAFNYTHGQWRKLGFLVRAPLTQDGRLYMSMRHVWGVTELDALSVLPVSDRQIDALNSFVQGPQ